MPHFTLRSGFKVLLDEEDASLITSYTWRVRRQLCPSGLINWMVVRSERKADGTRTTVYLSRVVADAAPGQVVDHVNHDGLDNRRSNLRVCSTAQNNCNRRKGATRTSQFKGVFLDAGIRGSRPRWRAMVRVNGAKVYRSSDTEVGAALAYDDLARKHHGAFACLNFPNPGERSAHAASPGEVTP